ncbi:MAG TPA: type II secretion system protein GspL [Allosphingosinicella sp.]|jgi:general secretion pathway protein L
MSGARMLIVFLAARGEEAGWALAVPGAVEAHGLGLETLPAGLDDARVVLAAPGDRVALHWLDLPADLSRAQAEAAARLALGAATIASGECVHVAVGEAEGGRRCVGIVDAEEMNVWLARLDLHGLRPDHVIPEPLLLLPPASGYRRREAADLACYRAEAEGFAAEPSLARHLTADAGIEEVDDAAFEAELFDAVLRAPLDLQQGRFARRRVWRKSWQVDAGAGRRIAALAVALLCATVGLGTADLFRHAHAAGRLEREARALAPPAAAAAAPHTVRASFGALSSVVFDAVRATPNVELAALEYGENGALSFTIRADSPATAEALRERLSGSGYRADLGPAQHAGSQSIFPLVLRSM